jgi:hypothetical protein
MPAWQAQALSSNPTTMIHTYVYVCVCVYSIVYVYSLWMLTFYEWNYTAWIFMQVQFLPLKHFCGAPVRQSFTTCYFHGQIFLWVYEIKSEVVDSWFCYYIVFHLLILQKFSHILQWINAGLFLLVFSEFHNKCNGKLLLAVFLEDLSKGGVTDVDKLYLCDNTIHKRQVMESV